MLFFVPQPGTQNQQNCKDTEIQLASCREKLRIYEARQKQPDKDCQAALVEQKKQLSEQVRRANDDCQAKLQEQKKVLSQQATARYGQLQAELTAAQSDLQTCQRDYSRLKGDLAKAQNDLHASQASYDALKQDFAKSERTVNELRSQNAQQKTAYETQLAERQATIDARTRELADKNSEISSKTKQIAQLNSTNVGLAADLSKLNQSLKSAEQARIAADQATTELKKGIDALTAEQQKQPAVVLGLIKEFQTKMDQPGAPVTITQGKDGSIKRELVIGTLEVKPYPTEIPAGGQLQLIAIFTPRPLPGGIASDTPWYVNLVFNPPPGINAAYNQKESLGEEVREVHLGTDHKWVWLVDAPKDSQAVLAATQMDILAGFQKDKVDRIAGQPVVLTRGKPAPGFFAVIFESVKANLTYILGTIASLFAIWVTFLTVKWKRVELAKAEKAETT